LVKVLDGIYSIDFSEEGNHGMELWILNCSEGTVLIDTGMRDKALNLIEADLKSMGKTWSDIGTVLITHKHGDHINNLARLKKLTGARIMSQKHEAPLIEKATGVKVEGLEHGAKLPYCGGIEVVHVPGHSEGNSCYYLPTRKIMIAGDTIFAEDGELIAPPERYCLDAEQATKGMERLLDYDFDVFMYTHGEDIMENAKEKVRELVEKTRK
jgi:glyoxylase-like metal-dependent hydrolase (beta-lactamase superfamily II)